MVQPYVPDRVVTIVLGGFFGDEGKGKVISYLANEFQHVARGGVGSNAGHTVVSNDHEYGLRMLPSGFTNPDAKLYIGKGVLVDPNVLLEELEECDIGSRFYVDRLCPVIEQRHIDADGRGFYKEEVGSTGTGCGPTQLERVGRSPELKFVRDIGDLESYQANVSSMLLAAIEQGEPVLVEMTQGAMLSNYGYEIDGQLTHPNSTSKDTTAGTACADVGVGPTNIKDVIVVYKAIPSRVGQGVFPGRLPLEDQERLREEGKGEYGTVTGRPRDLGKWTSQVYDFARTAAHANGATQIALTKIDALDEKNRGVTEYDRLTVDAKVFIEGLEDDLQRPVTLIGTGQDMKAIIDRR